MSFSADRARRNLLLVSCFLLGISSFVLFVIEPGYIDPAEYSSSLVVTDKNDAIIYVALSDEDEWCIPISLDKMGKWIAPIAIALEDKRFYEHNGIDFIALLRSTYYNLRAGRVVTGASTITSQLIRISNPRPRTLLTKMQEFWSAMFIDTIYDKNTVLELYLNRAPFGGNVRGIEAAARVYFNKTASTLTLSESTMLISMLRSPSLFRPDRNSIRAENERNRRIDFLTSREIITWEMAESAKAEELPKTRYLLPRNAEMACRHVVSGTELSNNIRVKSTLDMAIHKMLENQIEESLRTKPQAVTAAGIVVENESGEVRAYVGNARQGSALPGSQVDCGNAPRSPGSTLKPFIYAAAFERGLLTPGSLLADTPLAFSGNAPRNFSRSYQGPVSARYALYNSLNAPAVRVLRMVGYNFAATLLRNIGFSRITREGGYYTDSLILGGCEVTLIELAAAYRTLANLGLYSRPLWVSDGDSRTFRVITPAASYLTADVIADSNRLTEAFKNRLDRRGLQVAYKTGTSHGMRDAWSAGYNEDYTVVVWLGIPDGRADASLVGALAAQPVMFSILDSLPPLSSSERAFERPAEVYTRDVCRISGGLPGRNCPRISDIAIRDISSTKLCNLHSNRRGDGEITWPPEIADWIKNNPRGIGRGIKITTPSPSRDILLTGLPAARTKFMAEGPLPQYWYLDDVYIGVDETGDGIFCDVVKGEHRVAVLADGAEDSLVFRVVDIRDILKNEDFNLLN